MAQTKVKLIADGVIVQGNLHASHGITTADIGENASYLYYTDARVSNYLSTNGYDTATNIIASITDSAPSTLDTLNELAAALGDDANFSTTVTNSIALKAPLASPSFTGVPSFSLNDGTFIKAVNATNNVASTNIWGYGLYEGGSKLAEISLVRDGSNNQMYIGTTTANQTLRIGTGNKVTALTIDASQNSTFAGNVTISQPTNGAEAKLTLTSKSAAGNSRTGIIEYDADVEKIFFINEGTTIAAMTSDGKVGIGTDSPETNAKLDVRAGSGGKIVLGTYDANYKVVVEGGDQLNFYNGASAATAYMNYGFTGTPGNILLSRNLFVEANSSGGTSGTVRIKSDGKVGIGTTSPGQKLEVYQAATNSQAYVTVQNNRSRNAAVLTQTTNGGFYTGTSIGTDTLCWQVYDASAGERMRITSGGDIEVQGGDIFLNSGTNYNDKGVVYLSNERTAIISDIVNLTANGDTSLDFQTRSGGTRASAMFIDEFRNATFSKAVNIAGTLTLDQGSLLNGIINTPASLRINIDSDNNQTGEKFIIGHSQTNIDNNNILLEIYESGAAEFTGNLGIGIGANSAYKLRIKTDATHQNGAYISAGTGNGNHSLYVEDRDATAEFFAVRGDGEIRLNASNQGHTYARTGVRLGANAAANNLDDYEEGTWTPTSNLPGATVSSYGKYTKIGNIVYIAGKIEFTGKTGTAVNVVIDSLPFSGSNTSDTQTRPSAFPEGDLVNMATVVNNYGHFRVNGNQMQGVIVNSSGNTIYMSSNNFSSSGEFNFSVVYTAT